MTRGAAFMREALVLTDTWYGKGEPPPPATIGFTGWLRVFLRGVPIGVLLFVGLIILLLIRLVEKPLFGLRRPFTPYLVQFVCRNVLRILGLRLRIDGTPMSMAGAVVANHSSWLDIFVLNSRKRVYFVSKSEVASWPGIGWLARATGTVFIKRSKKAAPLQVALLGDRLAAGHQLLFFPEGTSTDGRRVLPFKSTLFAALLTSGTKDDLHVQPVTVQYHAPHGQDPRFYSWWGDMALAPHALAVLAVPLNGSAAVTYHPQVSLQDVVDRKVLSRMLEETVRRGLASHGSLEVQQR